MRPGVIVLTEPVVDDDLGLLVLCQLQGNHRPDEQLANHTLTFKLNHSSGPDH